MIFQPAPFTYTQCHRFCKQALKFGQQLICLNFSTDIMTLHFQSSAHPLERKIAWMLHLKIILKVVFVLSFVHSFLFLFLLSVSLVLFISLLILHIVIISYDLYLLQALPTLIWSHIVASLEDLSSYRAILQLICLYIISQSAVLRHIT